MTLFIIFILWFGVYFLPSLYAAYKKHPDLTGITVLNLFLGWTFIGWVVALVWAVQNK